ncbi:conjugal transfer protein TraB, partial [Salmonella enterica subsp. enterica serovar Weltevreden]|nr:conjugal transfer protein TraB [Salmonella enterica subsp. enterica serovar Weltevreden]
PGPAGAARSAPTTHPEYDRNPPEQDHPVIPIGAGNEVTLVVQDGFQLETLDEVRATAAARKNHNPPSATSTPSAMPGNT